MLSRTWVMGLWIAASAASAAAATLTPADCAKSPDAVITVSGKQTLPCAKILPVTRKYPVEAAGKSWIFSGERKVREELKASFGLTLPPDTVPIGYVDRVGRNGQRLVLVFDDDFPRREPDGRFVEDAADHRASLLQIGVQAGALHSDPGDYASVRIYFAESGRKKDLRYLGWFTNSEGVAFKGRSLDSATTFATCLPCTGWLCPEAPIACFSQFFPAAPEEVHMLAFSPPDPETLVSLQFAADRFSTILPEVWMAGAWMQTEKGWAFKTSPRGEAGGDICPKYMKAFVSPSRVYAREPYSDLMIRAQDLEKKLVPYDTRPLPADCGYKLKNPSGEFFYDVDDKLVKFIQP